MKNIEGDVGSNAPVARTDWETEINLPQYQNPKIKAEIAALERNREIDTTEPQNAEFAQQAFENNYRARRQFRWQGQERWQGRENEEMRLVRFMHPHSFIERLARTGIDARLEPHRNARLWLNDFSREGLVGVTAWVITAEGRVQKTVSSLQYPYGPEWDLMGFNEYNNPTRLRFRGWRTVLLALIREDVITEDEAHKAFGSPVLNRASELYRQQLQGIRQIRMGLAV